MQYANKNDAMLHWILFLFQKKSCLYEEYPILVSPYFYNFVS